MREAYAFRQVLQRHNIDVDVAAMDLSKLNINNHQVEGDIDYTPTPVKPTPPTRGQEPRGLTVKDVSTMTAQQIKANWKQVSQVLASSPGGSTTDPWHYLTPPSKE